MRTSQFLLATLKETPHDAEVVSHQLMLRAGLIRKLGSGLYTWLPLGLRVLHKVEQIVREEMNRAGAMEVLMPAVQPAELWHETGRWETFGGQLLKMKDSGERDYCFGPTHEEVITDLMRRELNSYKQLPANFYQIQTKFRDEIRPRFGVMRAREFIMKDAYSFHIEKSSLEQTYQIMYQTYSNIFSRMGLKFRAVEADTGAIGGSASHEFQVLADSGEDLIFYSDESDYAANIEQASSLTPEPNADEAHNALALVETPNQKTIEEVVEFLSIPVEKTVKTLIVEGEDDTLVALVLRGDDELNPIKAEKHPLVKAPLTFASEEQVKEVVGVDLGSLGPVDLVMPVIADHHALAINEFVCGANLDDKHFTHANWQRDCVNYQAFDLRNVKQGDASPDGKGKLKMCRGIEVGHIFQLGDKYSQAMNATVLNEQGKATPMMMGCYGLGISRVVAAAIEQNHDDKGICWPAALAPFQLVIIPMNMHKSELVKDKALAVYQALKEKGYEVLLDDRNERAGVMFADSELIGIPHQVVIGERSLKEGFIEYQQRGVGEKQSLASDDIEALEAKLN